MKTQELESIIENRRLTEALSPHTNCDTHCPNIHKDYSFELASRQVRLKSKKVISQQPFQKLGSVDFLIASSVDLHIDAFKWNQNLFF